jgi:hypothetical protein
MFSKNVSGQIATCPRLLVFTVMTFALTNVKFNPRDSFKVPASFSVTSRLANLWSSLCYRAISLGALTL